MAWAWGFRFAVPSFTAMAARSTQRPIPPAAASFDSRCHSSPRERRLMSDEAKLYIVDDDAGMRDSLRFLFQARGIEAESFSSAHGFLAASGAPKCGCVLAAVRMPGMNGLELQQHLAAENSRLAVILMTGHADVPMAVTAMRAGAFD